MACSWVMVWIPTKTLERKNSLGIATNPTHKHRIRLFSDASTITEGSQEELQFDIDSVNASSRPPNHPNRGEGIPSQLSAENTHNVSFLPSETAAIQKGDLSNYVRKISSMSNETDNRIH